VCACGTEASEKEMIDEDNQYKQKTTTQHKVLFHFIDYYRHLHLYDIFIYKYTLLYVLFLIWLLLFLIFMPYNNKKKLKKQKLKRFLSIFVN